MRQFTLSTPNGTLLGFLVLIADNDDEPISGSAMIQAHTAALPPEDAAPARAWKPWPASCWFGSRMATVSPCMMPTAAWRPMSASNTYASAATPCCSPI